MVFKERNIQDGISALLGLTPQRVDEGLLSAASQTRDFWSSYDPAQLTDVTPVPFDFDKILDRDWQPLWELFGHPDPLKRFDPFRRPPLREHCGSPTQLSIDFWRFP
eukprot:6361155-Heterocapsa_arctica.AAC.1